MVHATQEEEEVSVEGMLTDLLFVRRFFNVVLMLLAQLNLHPPVQLHQFLLIRLELGQKTAQALMEFHFTSCLGFNRILSCQQVHNNGTRLAYYKGKGLDT